MDGPMRFTELRRSIDIVSQPMLTRTLRGLERDGLVSRTMHPVIPRRVDDELTNLGCSLQGVLAQLAEWAFAHHDNVAHVRETYDTMAAEPDHSGESDGVVAGPRSNLDSP
jgi:DNA-binding HxlR family transcriptional regulator